MDGLKLDLTESSLLQKTAFTQCFSDINASSFFSVVLNLLRLKDPQTYTHCIRVSELTHSMGMKLGFNGRNLVEISTAAYLHDIGKLVVSDRILKKNGSLTEHEYRNMQKHAVMGAEMLSELKSMKRVREIIRQHHESFDGSGYPDGLSGAEIDIGARIIALADNFDALTADRIYRKRLSCEDVLDWMEQKKDTQFDPELCTMFIGLMGNGFRFSPFANFSTQLFAL